MIKHHGKRIKPDEDSSLEALLDLDCELFFLLKDFWKAVDELMK